MKKVEKQNVYTNDRTQKSNFSRPLGTNQSAQGYGTFYPKAQSETYTDTEMREPKRRILREKEEQEMTFSEITADCAISFLLPRHYSGRVPSICKAFGWFDDDGNLKAVCTFGKPASPSLCDGVCGKDYSQNVYELNRLCRTDDLTAQLSQFVAACLRFLKRKDWIIVSYSDTQMHHNGYIYQACNFIYTGCTKSRTDLYTNSGKHSRHYRHEAQSGMRKVRSAKHRYVYFCTADKKTKHAWMSALKYPVCDYPKGVNENYILGHFMQDVIIKDPNAKPINYDDDLFGEL